MAVHKKYNRSVLGRGLDEIEGGRGLDLLSTPVVCARKVRPQSMKFRSAR